MKVTVTKQDIVKGRAARKANKAIGHSCPVWQAINRITEGALGYLWVGSYDVGRWKANDDERVVLPISARHWIHDFDTGSDVKPFTFELEIPAT